MRALNDPELLDGENDQRQMALIAVDQNESEKRHGRVIFDVTDFVGYMVKSHTVSGIQRVISAVAEQILDPEKILFSVRSKGTFRAIPYRSGQPPIEAIRAYIDWKRAIRTVRTRHSDLSERWGAVGSALSGWGVHALRPVTFQETDIFFIFGAVWNKKSFLRSVSEAKEIHRFQLIVFVHDAIPIFGEEFVSHGAFRNFRDYLEWIDDWADAIYCNSNYSKADLVRTKLVSKASDAVIIPLAHEFSAGADKSSDESRHHLRLFLREQFDRHHTDTFALCVGTIETRKNQALLAKAWAELARERPMPLLILAGRLATNGDALKIILDRDHPPVAILENANDAMLEQLYKKCEFTVFPSHFEGWGLPVGESLWFGKPCLASNASSIPEVGGDYAIYFDPHSIEDIKEKIRGFLDGTITRPIPPRSALRTWQQVAEDLVSHLRQTAIPAPLHVTGSTQDEHSISLHEKAAFERAGNAAR